MSVELERSDARLSKDVRLAVTQLDDRAASFILDLYYDFQKMRIAIGNQCFAYEQDGAPSATLQYFQDELLTLEKKVGKLFPLIAGKKPWAEWFMKQTGVGPVTACTFAVRLDHTRSPHPAGIIRICGLDMTARWLPTDERTALVRKCLSEADDAWDALARAAKAVQRVPKSGFDSLRRIRIQDAQRSGEDPSEIDHDTPPTEAEINRCIAMSPWDNQLKRACYILGGSFIKTPSGHYGAMLRERKALIEAQNEEGKFAEYAERTLRDNPPPVGSTSYVAMQKGQLSKTQILGRARRYAVSRALRDLHNVARTHLNLPISMPYAIAHGQGKHADFEFPPNITDEFKAQMQSLMIDPKDR